MKRIFIALAALALLSTSLRADEGMWLLPLLQRFNAESMAQAGCKLSPEQIYSINSTSLKDAVVMFGSGCTGEIISDEGLLVTNHHCGYANIQKLSSVEHDYLKNGYWAMERSQELPCEGLSVTFLVSIQDVTSVIENARAKAAKKYRKKANHFELEAAAVQTKIDALEKEVEAANPNCTATVMGYYDENLYLLLVYKKYTDIRFVGAPPSSIGKFGADTDNWMWPRHTCDFSMFRVYAGPDNEPAAYSPDNQPLKAPNSLKISLKGLSEGDYAMVMGYPGTTKRFQTSNQLAFMLEQNDMSIAARTARQNVMLEDMLADPAIKIKYASKYTRSSNYWKKWQGMKLAFNKLGIIERKENEEAAFLAWANEDEARAAKYGSVIEGIAAETEAARSAKLAQNLVKESIALIEIANFASAVNRNGDLLRKEDVEGGKELIISKMSGNYKDYSAPTDQKVTKAMLKFYSENAESVASLEELLGGKSIDAWVDELFEASAYTSLEKLVELYENQGVDAILSDPVFELVKWVRAENIASREMGAAVDPAVLKRLQHTYTEGQLERNGDVASYPDANFTMRLTYGNVKGYSPKDGVVYLPYTTLDGVMEKEDPNNWEFVVPEKLKELWAAQDFGDYAMSNGKMPVAFLTNCDITGGNSGSPVLNAYGELVGLAFDGNWESMSSDVMFEPELQRCICVDIRYVLFIVDKFGGAGYLLDEMQIEK